MQRILLIDDDPLFRSGLLRIFKAMRGLQVSFAEASSGQEGMKMLLSESIDCALLDFRMPGGDGLGWLRKFVGLKPDLAVIMITGAGDEAVAVDAMKAGADDYLVKGAITPEALERAVRGAILKKEMARTIRGQQEALMQAERQRVMIESLGAACHHLGQPATVITTYLAMMELREKTPELLDMISRCRQAAESMADLLTRFSQVSEYRTVPYLPATGQPDGPDVRHILDI